MNLTIDANVLVALALPTPASEQAAAKVEGWLEAGNQLFAPSLWSYEAVSAIRKFVSSGMISQDEAFTAVEYLVSLGVQDVTPTIELHRKALIWARPPFGFRSLRSGLSRCG